MEWYKILFIVISCIAAFGWFVYFLRWYKEREDKKNGEPIFRHLDYQPPVLDSNLVNPYA